MQRGSDAATRGLLLALAGLCVLPMVLVIVASVPEGARVTAFLLGLGTAAAVAGRGGWLARRAFTEGCSHPARAFVGAALGLSLAATAAMILVWTSIGVLVG